MINFENTSKKLFMTPRDHDTETTFCYSEKNPETAKLY